MPLTDSAVDASPQIHDHVADLPAAITIRLREMLAANEALGGQLRRALQISPSERLALIHLRESGPMTMGELGALIPLSRPAMTSLVDSLEDAGYVRRTTDGADRRRTVVEITDLPFTLAAPVLLPFTEELQRRLAGYSPAECRTILAFTTMINELSRRHARQLGAVSDGDLLHVIGRHAATG